MSRPPSSPRFCVIIPVFRHEEPLRGVLAALGKIRPLPIPCVLIDDGNTPPLAETLRQECAAFPWVNVLRLTQNRGKGVAATEGFRWAQRQGYTHALTLDADGQHQVSDLLSLMKLSHEHPETLVLGRPVFREDAPWSRKWGRFISNVWVWIETRSFAIGDSLCGLRCYPLAPVLQLLDQTPSLSPRMGFDPEIAVRLCWAGVPVCNVETTVCYPVGGISNFDLWRDNLRLSLLHARLFLGMLRRWGASQGPQ